MSSPNDERAAGLLAHPTSLPGPFGHGDLGTDTLRFLDWAAEAGQSVWQLLPLGPPGGDHSPYSARSAFAGNPRLVSPGLLADRGLVDPDELKRAPRFPSWRVDFALTDRWRDRILRLSWEAFQRSASIDERRALKAFATHPDRAAWLDDWTLFAALKECFDERPWCEWDRPLRLRDPSALRAARRDLGDAVAYHGYAQFVFFRQWQRVREAAAVRGIRLLGDLPFYPAYDSADVWSRPDLFLLDAEGRPEKVAGVPPDYFSEDGQLWGNPIYRWDRSRDEGHAWWIARLRANLELYDCIRLDHFRAFAAYWEVDAGEKTAVGGRWVQGPGRELFERCREVLGELPLVAEDLGEITDDVRKLRSELGLPGMRVLQFGFEDDESEHRLDRIADDCVVYTGTHDNDTIRGWFGELSSEARERVLAAVGTGPEEVTARLIELAYASDALLAVVPLQDVFDLDGSARMNRPGVARGNWRWRARPERFTLRESARLRALGRATRRPSVAGTVCYTDRPGESN